MILTSIDVGQLFLVLFLWEFCQDFHGSCQVNLAFVERCSMGEAHHVHRLAMVRLAVLSVQWPLPVRGCWLQRKHLWPRWHVRNSGSWGTLSHRTCGYEGIEDVLSRLVGKCVAMIDLDFQVGFNIPICWKKLETSRPLVAIEGM